MTLIVLALDAVDARLVEEFDCTRLRLDAHTDLETVASEARGTPHTMEVWPSVATGERPEEHGVEGSDTSSWDNSVVDFASRFTGVFSERTRARLGRVAKQFGAELSSGRVGSSSFLDGQTRAVREWPGVADSGELVQVWEWVKQASDGTLTTEEFERRVMGTCGAQFGWVRETARHDVSLVATHVHTVDAFGHPYATDRDRLAHWYRRLDEYVGQLVETTDAELLIVSDHGMQVEWLDDDPGQHSWHAFAASTVGRPPTHVLDVREWVETHVDEVTTDEESMEMPTETLRQLGYLE